MNGRSSAAPVAVPGAANPNPVSRRLTKVLVANRGEIAKRFFHALREEGILSVAVVTDPDRLQSWYEFADEICYIGAAGNYAKIEPTLAAVRESGADGVYPGYGFLSENSSFAEKFESLRTTDGRPVLFMGPDAAVMRRVGNKIDARRLAKAHGIPLFEGSELIADVNEAFREADKIGYPVLIKLNAGGGGKGMTPVFAAGELRDAVESAMRIGTSMYGDAAFYMEKLIVKPVHIEVQIFNGVAVGIRKCAVQRRNQKIIEESGEGFLDRRLILKLLAAAEGVAEFSGYANGAGAGTVEFLFDRSTSRFGFLEMNTRLQVEYAVTDQSVGIDLVKWQIMNFDGREKDIPYDRAVSSRFQEREYAIQCRIYAEDPYRGYAPSPGNILELQLPTFNGIRCDFGFRSGDRILSDYDPMIGKLISRGRSRLEAMTRMERALGELYVRGITTNVDQLLSIVRDDVFRSGDYDNNLLRENPLLEDECHLDDPVFVAAAAAAVEYRSHLAKTVRTVFGRAHLADVMDRAVLFNVPAGYDVELGNSRFRIDIFESARDHLGMTVNGRWYGEAGVTALGMNDDAFHVLLNGRSFPVRRDHRPGFVTLRFTDGSAKIRYARIRFQPLGEDTSRDPAGLLRCPFQSRFVRFGVDALGSPLRPGSRVEAGDTIAIVSAMKMETMLTAPVSGTITSLVEDGNLQRLVEGRTADGLILGRPFVEGEIIGMIEPATGEGGIPAVSASGHEVARNLSGWAGLLAARDGDPGPAPNQADALRMARILLLGFRDARTASVGLDAVLAEMENANLPGDGQFYEWCVETLDIYAALRRVFSESHGPRPSGFAAMDALFARWEDRAYVIPFSFRAALGRVYAHYGMDKVPDSRTAETQAVFFQVLRSCLNLPDSRRIAVSAARALLRLGVRSARLGRIADSLLREGHSAEDEELLRFSARLVSVSAKRIPASAPGGASVGLQPIAEAWKEIPDIFPMWFKEQVAARLMARKKEDILLCVESTPCWTVLCRAEDGAHAWRCFAFVADGRPVAVAGAKRLPEVPNLTGAAGHAARALGEAVAKFPARANVVEILANRDSIVFDAGGQNPAHFNYEMLQQTARGISRRFLEARAHMVFVTVKADRSAESSCDQTLLFHLKGGRIRVSPVPVEDPRHPLHVPASDTRDRRIFSRGKRPASWWCSQTADPGSIAEIAIESIDGLPGGERADVGAALVECTMDNAPALFYLKDSRRKGGATGDREGRKYVAAVYLAYRLDIPLYVWNDGAGANIKEGVVSLFRAGQGFMVNALAGSRPPVAVFREFLQSADDPMIRSLVCELDTFISKRPDALELRNPKRFFLAAIGIGSSTGLDVYGSSQAAVQLMLDDPESYRVLTGAGVIRSVTGENLTNYEIGGGRVMADDTGTVDLLALDSLDLVYKIRNLHRTMCDTSESGGRPSAAGLNRARRSRLLPDEQTLRQWSDHQTFLPLKESFAGSASLVGGLVRFGGTPSVVIAPRSGSGIFSTASILRAAELVRTASKTGSCLFLFSEDHWMSDARRSEPGSLRARADFYADLAKHRFGRIHVVIGEAGLADVGLHAGADAVILVSDDATIGAGEGVASFVVADVNEAVALGMRAAGYLRNRTSGAVGKKRAASPNVSVTIPDDAGQPFDMRSQVVEKILDEGDFLEFFRGAEEPNLLTGIGRLNGRTVGVIADQPLRGGAPDAPGTEKFRVFVEWLEHRSIPLVMISNAPGFVPGVRQEKLRIQQIGGRSLDVNVLSTMPVVSVTLHQNYGGRYIQAFSKSLRPGIRAVAWSKGTIAVMGARAAFDLFHGAQLESLTSSGKDKEGKQIMQKFFREFAEKSSVSADASSVGAIDVIFDHPSDLRTAIWDALAASD